MPGRTQMKFYTVTHRKGQWKKCGGCNWGVRKVWRYGKEPIDIHMENSDYANGLCCYCMKELIEENAWDLGDRGAAKALAECKQEIEREKGIEARQRPSKTATLTLKKVRARGR